MERNWTNTSPPFFPWIKSIHTLSSQLLFKAPLELDTLSLGQKIRQYIYFIHKNLKVLNRQSTNPLSIREIIQFLRDSLDQERRYRGRHTRVRILHLHFLILDKRFPDASRFFISRIRLITVRTRGRFQELMVVNVCHELNIR